MSKKKIAILGLAYVSESEAMGFMDDGNDSYKHFRLKKGCEPEILGEYQKKQFGGRWQFVVDMRMSNRNCFYFKRREEVDQHDLGELIAIYIMPSCGEQQNSTYVNPEKADSDSVRGSGDWAFRLEGKAQGAYN